jgi:hypothetical protein
LVKQICQVLCFYASCIGLSGITRAILTSDAELALLNPGMNFGVSAALRAALTPKFRLQISNADAEFYILTGELRIGRRKHGGHPD